MHPNRFRLALCPRPRWGSLHAPPDPIAVFKGPTSKGKEKEGKRGKKKGREREGERKGMEGRGRTTLHTPCRKFLATPLAYQEDTPY